MLLYYSRPLVNLFTKAGYLFSKTIKPQNMEAMFSLIVIVLIIALIFAIVSYIKSERKKLKELKQQYEQSLKGTNKRAALNAGRAYYTALRKEKVLTAKDEQAITNDLSTMNEASLL
jgi:hypothetical protein